MIQVYCSKREFRHIFSMMLCLRQLTGHILLIQKVLSSPFSVSSIADLIIQVLKDVLQIEDVEALMILTSQELSPEKCNGASLKEIRDIIIKAKTKKVLPQSEAQGTPKRQDNTKTPPETPQDDRVDLGRGFGLTFRFRRCLKQLYESSKWDELTSRSLCHHCLQPPEDPMVTDCLHLYCKECLNAIAFEASKKDQDRAACKECGKIFESATPCNGIKELSFAGDHRTPRDREASIDSSGRARKTGKSSKSRDEDLDLDWISELGSGHMLSSAKTMAVKMQVTSLVSSSLNSD